MLCESVTFNTGDDCIAIDSGKDRDVGLGPAQDRVIQNCVMHSGHGGLTIGSLMGGGVRNVYARGLAMHNSHWDSNPLNIAIRIKSNLNRGGFVENVNNVFARDIAVNGLTGSCFQALVAQGPVAFDYNGPTPAPRILPEKPA